MPAKSITNITIGAFRAAIIITIEITSIVITIMIISTSYHRHYYHHYHQNNITDHGAELIMGTSLADLNVDRTHHGHFTSRSQRGPNSPWTLH